jgi:phage terminase large subunit GpA-like protein
MMKVKCPECSSTFSLSASNVEEVQGSTVLVQLSSVAVQCPSCKSVLHPGRVLRKA